MNGYRRLFFCFSVLFFVFFVSTCGGGGGSSGSNATSSSPANTLNLVAQAAGRHDNAAVISNFVGIAQQKYAGLFSDNVLLDKLQDSLSKATEVSTADNSAVYRSTFVDNTVNYSYYIYLIRGGDGRWRIDEF